MSAGAAALASMTRSAARTAAMGSPSSARPECVDLSCIFTLVMALSCGASKGLAREAASYIDGASNGRPTSSHDMPRWRMCMQGKHQQVESPRARGVE